MYHWEYFISEYNKTLYTNRETWFGVLCLCIRHKWFFSCRFQMSFLPTIIIIATSIGSTTVFKSWELNGLLIYVLIGNQDLRQAKLFIFSWQCNCHIVFFTFFSDFVFLCLVFPRQIKKCGLLYIIRSVWHKIDFPNLSSSREKKLFFSMQIFSFCPILWMWSPTPVGFSRTCRSLGAVTIV